MCLSPRYITNRSLHWNLFQPLKMVVPCGKCVECQNSKRSEWFVRSYFEWKRSKMGFFYTLTYNNEHLPSFDGVPVFCKKHLQDFIKRLRYRLDKHDIKLKYLFSCEYGELRKRSHYHVLFFVDKEINPYWFLRFVDDSWQFGFVKSGDNVGVINSDMGIQYVTKYITKDSLHLDALLPVLAPKVFSRYYKLFNYFIKRYGHAPLCTFRMNSDYSFSRVLLGRCSDDDLELVQKFLTKIRRQVNRYQPFHMQSSRFGANMIERVNESLEKVPVLKSSGKVELYKIPRYIKRLLWYDCVEGENSHKKDTFVLNDKGKKHLLEKIDLDIANDKNEFEKVLLNCSSINSIVLKPLKELGYDFKYVRDLVHWCQHFDLDLEVLSIYKNVFRGRVDFCGYENLNSAFIKDSWKDVFEYHLNSLPSFDFGEIYKDSHMVACLTSLLWNNNAFFQIYEYALQIIGVIQWSFSLSSAEAQKLQEKESRHLREFIKYYY